MPQIREERDLECPSCEGINCFTRAEGARVTSSGQIVHPPKGLWCLKCSNPVEGADLLRREQLKRKKEEYEQLEKELAAGSENRKPAVRAMPRS